MTAEAIALAVREETGEGTYSFVCPSCRTSVEKRADRKVVMLLLSAGVQVENVEDAAGEAAEQPFDRPEGPAFTKDDLLDFHLLLASEDWFSQLTASAE